MNIYTVKYKLEGFGGAFPKEGVVAVVADNEASAVTGAMLEVAKRATDAAFTIQEEDYAIVGDEPRPTSTPVVEEEGDETQELAKRFLYENKITGWAVGKKHLFYATAIPPEMNHNEIISQFNQWQESWKS